MKVIGVRGCERCAANGSAGAWRTADPGLHKIDSVLRDSGGFATLKNHPRSNLVRSNFHGDETKFDSLRGNANGGLILTLWLYLGRRSNNPPTMSGFFRNNLNGRTIFARPRHVSLKRRHCVVGRGFVLANFVRECVVHRENQ